MVGNTIFFIHYCDYRKKKMYRSCNIIIKISLPHNERKQSNTQVKVKTNCMIAYENNQENNYLKIENELLISRYRDLLINHKINNT